MVEPRAEVFLRAQGGDRSAQELICQFYARYVKRIVGLYHRENRGDKEDHQGVANLGLAKALKFYDPKKNDSFARYAALIIRRDLMTANRANERRFDRTVFVDEEETLEDLSFFVPGDASTSEMGERVQALLNHVDPIVRRATELIAIEGESVGDAAGLLGLKRATLVAMLARAFRFWEANGSIETITVRFEYRLTLVVESSVRPLQMAFSFETEAA